MEHTPFGYVIVDGKPKVHDMEAARLAALYSAYLLGMSYENAAEVAGIKTYPHIFGSAVGLFASLQFLAAIPDVPHAWKPEDIWVEYDQTENPFRVELAEEKVEKDGNYLIVPDRPGIGVTVREDILEKYRVL